MSILKHILITGISSWIWEYLAKNLLINNTITWVSRKNTRIQWINILKWDLLDNSFLVTIAEKSDIYDYVIFNAWIWYFDEFTKISLDKNKETIEINLISPILLTQLLLERNKIKSWIIFIWSIAWKKSMKNWASYAASKFWLRWFAMQLKNELKRIKVHIINPSIVDKSWELKTDSIKINKCHPEFISEPILKSFQESIIQWYDLKQTTKYAINNCSEWQNITLKNNFKHFKNYKKTPLEDILVVVENIINWNENMFEIDV